MKGQPRKNIKGQIYGYISVGDYLGKGRWRCTCMKCYRQILKITSDLESGKALMCDACMLAKVLEEKDRQA